MYKEIGFFISQRRKELGINQSELAARLARVGMAVTNQAISKWENGSTMPNAKQFLLLCDALEIDDIKGYFSGKSQGLLSGLDRDGRMKALDYIQLLRDSGRYTQQEEKIVPLRRLPCFCRYRPVSRQRGL